MNDDQPVDLEPWEYHIFRPTYFQTNQSMNETSPKTLGPCQCVKEFVHRLALALWTPRQFFGSIQRVCCVQQKVWNGLKRLGKLANNKTNKGKYKQIKHRQKATRQSKKWKTMENTHNGSGTRDVAIQALVNCLNRACAPNTHQTPTHRYRYTSKLEHFKTLNDPQTLKFVDHFITV